MKYEWKKQEKSLYGVGKSPILVNVPQQQFIMISGKGNPNNADFSDRVSALYSLAYAVKMNYKSAANACAEDISDYSVYPLEGIWMQSEGTELIKEKLDYTIMIRQPDFITKDRLYAALDSLQVKKPNPLYEEIRFDVMQDGTCVEILHIGSYDGEPASFKIMDEFVKASGMERVQDCHREIYLNNAGRTDQSRLKTILRYQVKQPDPNADRL